MSEELHLRHAVIDFSAVYNPEFLKEGTTVEDFIRPDLIIVSTQDGKAERLMRLLYALFQRNYERLFFMNVCSAQLTKYAANAMLATKISFMNESANLSEKLRADIESVRIGIGADPRIGTQFAAMGVRVFPKMSRP